MLQCMSNPVTFRGGVFIACRTVVVPGISQQNKAGRERDADLVRHRGAAGGNQGKKPVAERVPRVVESRHKWLSTMHAQSEIVDKVENYYMAA
ncbi:hypothetical protein Shel_27880 [Slackia heliotrinireducens DSM 20476]|uniref:Uncharacterized protein n=1 Tax=Slackia heliotrinireducens (strain ATCC 29202 / DSM 20476 / NCTC 11029 / RHS 1) TaxID=471855 RepID=C7N445_SLAHD|nr:hypothetical protein Shel_27880 [Slackia heliotrinireducens DSM 20476]